MLPYYPDQLTAYFAFELSDSLLSAVRTGSATGLLTGFLRLQDTLPAYRWSPFLTNHDQTRTLTLLGGDVARAKLAATLLLTLPGLPFIYYGEEIGMTGDKPDPRLRTPMQWSPRPGVGFTTGKAWESPQPDSLTTNVAAEDADPSSLLNLYRRLIHLRRENEALATGKLGPLSASNPPWAAGVRRSLCSDLHRPWGPPALGGEAPRQDEHSVGWKRDRGAALRTVRQQIARALHVESCHRETHVVRPRIHKHDRVPPTIGDHVVCSAGHDLAETPGDERRVRTHQLHDAAIEGESLGRPWLIPRDRVPHEEAKLLRALDPLPVVDQRSTGQQGHRYEGRARS